MHKLRLLMVLLLFGSVAPAQSPKIVTAARANGTYRYRANEIRILALGHNKLRVRMDLTYEYKSQYGPMANTALLTARQQSKTTSRNFSQPIPARSR